MVRRAMVLAYGAIAYVAFLGVFISTIGFLANVSPKGIDEGASGPAGGAVLVNVGLLALFAVQHSVMARSWFKRWWTRFVPASIERSTFVLSASLVLALLLWQWRPLPASVWSVGEPWARTVLWGLYGLGWLIVVGSTFLIDHFDLFGLRQVVARARERPLEPVGFRQPLLYGLVRHPIMVGFLIAFWSGPDMSVGRMLFALLGTGYILIGVRFEERDLVASHGAAYERYAEHVPRFVPRLGPGSPAGRRAVGELRR
ncbi:MAG TPA: isoprenylcysteine carboxylmethyltransferase family protein [Actinomycetota bacterium]